MSPVTTQRPARYGAPAIALHWVLGLAIVVMLMASATAISGVTLQLDENAVDILDKQVENRAGYIQDQLQQAQDLTELSSFINDTARQMLDEGKDPLTELDFQDYEPLPPEE